MIKYISRDVNKIGYCCKRHYKINKIDLLVNDMKSYKSFDYYADNSCSVCGDNGLKFFTIDRDNGDMV